MKLVSVLLVQQLFAADGFQAFSDRAELRDVLVDWYFNPGNRPAIEGVYGPIEDWDVSAVTSFEGLFSTLTLFNEDIGKWNTSQVTNMFGTFNSCRDFNRDIGSWDTSKVTTMSNMFANAWAFNQDIGSWDTSQVTDFMNMFNSGRGFNGNIASWDVSKVTKFRTMFRDAYAFNQPIDTWVTSRATDMRGMFERATAFNQPLKSWDVSNVSNFIDMFREATVFNQPLNSWDVSNSENFGSMFNGATVFNQCLDSWSDQINVTPSFNMFLGTSCPDEDCTVCPSGLWCEDLDALDYALLGKGGKLAAKKCLLHSLIKDYKFPEELPSWSRVATKAGQARVLCFVMVSLVVAAAAWRIRRQRPLVYEAL